MNIGVFCAAVPTEAARDFLGDKEKQIFLLNHCTWTCVVALFLARSLECMFGEVCVI